MSEVELSKISKVPIREIWPNEAQELTPWLADHLDQLGAKVGMDLELDEVEKAAGSFSLNILARDTSSHSKVVIENQLEQTDHDQLGKLITYAAGNEASVVIWITSKMRDEHREALEWLNSKTDVETAFFGIVIEAIKIDDSRPAPQFDVIVSPNDWQKSQKQNRTPEDAELIAERHRFFQPLIDDLRENHNFTNATKPYPRDYWFDFPTGVPDIYYSVALPTNKRDAKVMLTIYPSERNDVERVFTSLEGQKNEIEGEIGVSLTWEPWEGRKSRRITINREGSQGTKPSDDLRIWTKEHLLKFKDVFTPRLEAIMSNEERNTD